MWVAGLHVSSSERGAVQTKVHSVQLRVQTDAAKRRDAQTCTDSHALTTDSAGTLSLKSITGF